VESSEASSEYTLNSYVSTGSFLRTASTERELEANCNTMHIGMSTGLERAIDNGMFASPHGRILLGSDPVLIGVGDGNYTPVTTSSPHYNAPL